MTIDHDKEDGTLGPTYARALVGNFVVNLRSMAGQGMSIGPYSLPAEVRYNAQMPKLVELVAYALQTLDEATVIDYLDTFHVDWEWIVTDKQEDTA